MLPSALFVVSLTVILLLLGLAIAFSDWNLASPHRPQVRGPGH